MIIFDLDHTVIDSSHRQLTLPDGSLDLKHWKENCTREKIFDDKLLPIAVLWRLVTRISPRVQIGVCTARVVTQHDTDFLAYHGLKYNFLLSRPSGDNSPDGILKENLLRAYAQKKGVKFEVFCANISNFFDDNKNVLNRLRALNIKTRNAVKVNRELVSKGY